jgi:hypothetical protein
MRGLKCVTTLFICSAALFAADNPFLGTWKLNVAKSKGTPGTMEKEATTVFEADGDKIKRTYTAIDADGKPVKMADSIPWDGKAHQVSGGEGMPPAIIAVKRINDRTVDVTVKVNGKIVAAGRSVISMDGKTMTESFKGEDPKGRKFDNVGVSEKQ